MADDDIVYAEDRLPVAAPDLVVVETVDGRWQVVTVSAPLANLFETDPAEMRNRLLQGSFDDTVPALTELAFDAVRGEAPLRNVRIRFPGGRRPVLVAEVSAGLSDDFRRRMVRFHFRPLVPDEESRALVQYGMVGVSPAMHQVFRKIALYAPADAAVVITGETGTGKELVARALHDAGLRRNAPYVAVNCSAISEELLESELFGHEKGAFTGALRSHRGRFERADSGTLFLDEIGDMPLHTQTKLLRVLEEGVIERVGAERERRIDVRVVAATNVPLEQAVGRGRFRADLYHRLSVLRIHLPPLRERPEDIPALVEHFLRQFSRKYRRTIHRLTPEALTLLQSYLWPGNVRELRNVLERVFIETRSEAIGARAFGEWVHERQRFSSGQWEDQESGPIPRPAVMLPHSLTSSPDESIAGADRVLDVEYASNRTASRRSTRPVNLSEAAIRRAYQAADGNLAAAARLLGIHRATLYRYLKKLGISRDDLQG
jgi:transcriptional regulator with GAF, ATPase, and Fis domain